MNVWIVWELDDQGDMQGVAGLFDNESAARQCESSPEYLGNREAENWHVQPVWRGESRMC